jgi:hypothetical protein
MTSTPATEVPAPERPLRAFAVVWLPSLLLVIGSGLCVFAVNWWVSRAPGGGAQLGVIVGVSSGVALLSVTALSGTIDRADRRVMVLRLLIGLVAPLAVLTVILGGPPAAVAVLVAGVCYLLIFSFESLYLATIETVVVDLAPARWPSSRTALLTQLHPQVERIIAPAVAGALVAAGALQLVPGVALAIVAVVLVVVLATRRQFDWVTAQVAAAPPATGDPAGAGSRLRTVMRDATAAVRLIRDHRELRFLLWLGVLTNAVVYPFYAILPAFLTETGLSTRGQAVLYGRAATAYGVGMLAGTVLLLSYRLRRGTRRALALASAAFAAICVMLVAVTIVPWPDFVVVVMALDGALFAVLIAVGGAVWLRRTPAAIRVRVFSLRRLTVFSSIPLGTMLMGFGGAAVGYHSFVRGMVLVVLVGLIGLWLGYGRWLPHEEMP